MKIDDIYINYIDYGNKDRDTILLLHGWGQNIEMMKMLGDNFISNNRIVILDLPGFGESEEPKRVLTLDDYVLIINKLLTKLKITNPIIIGHSFGGKLGLLYAAKYKVNKLVCLASPYKKNIQKESLKLKILKFGKKIPGINKLEGIIKKHVGSADYKNASEIMRKILVSHVNYDITDKLNNIKCPTLLIWGTNDEAVSIEDAKMLEKLINNCGLVEYPGCTHYAYLERLDQTIRVLNSFLGACDNEN